MPTYIKEGGVWRVAAPLQVRVGGSWRQLQKAYAKVSGVWQLTHSAELVINIPAGNYDQLNLRTLADEAGFATLNPLRVTFIIEGVVGSTTTATPAVTTGIFPTGVPVTLSITSTGVLVGAGGRGGGKNNPNLVNVGGRLPDADGQQGGNALEIETPMTIINNGIIGGGGGGGGGARQRTATAWTVDGSPNLIVAGSGGAGSVAGLPGDTNVRPGTPEANRLTTIPGSLFTGGVGANWLNVQVSGAGGDLGQPGIRPNHAGGITFYEGLGGAPGAAIVTNGFVVNYSPRGDIRGSVL